MSRRPATGSSPDRPDIPHDLLEPAPGVLGDDDRWVAVHATAATVVADSAVDVELRECLVNGVDLSGRDLTRLRARDVRFEACDLSGTQLDSASLQRVEFTGCRMTGIQLTGGDLRDVALRECRADLVNLRMTTAVRLLARATSLREADLYRTRLTDVALLGCDLRSSAFRASRLVRVDLHGSRLDDLRDADGLGGARIAADQVVPLALALLAAQGITVTEEPAPTGPDDA